MDLSVLVLVMGLAILATTFVGSRRAVRTLAGTIVTRTEDVVVAQLKSFFATPTQQLQVARLQLNDGILPSPLDGDPDADRDALDRYLAPVIETTPQVSAIMVADERGREHMLLRDGDLLKSRVTRIDEWGREVRWLEWPADGGDPRSYRETTDYDPRRRPWFAGAIEARRERGEGAVHWTEPYTFFTTKDPGITVSIAFGSGDDVVRVVALDILLQDITRFTRSLEVGRRGRVGVLTADGRMLGLPRDERFEDPEARRAAYLKRPDELGLSLVTDATDAFRDVAVEGASTVRFESEGDAWWGRVTPFDLDPQRMLRVAVIVPESQLLGTARERRLAILAIVLAVLAIGVVRAVMLADRFSEPVELLAQQSARISAGDFTEGAPIESDLREIRRLAAAQHEMRGAVLARIKLDEVERDLDLAREIQRGLLPQAPPDVPGFEIAGWNQAADQTGGDYFDWLQLPSGQTIMTLADVTGHGIAPALIVAVCRAYVRAAATSDDAGLSHAVGWVNDLLYADTPAERFVTAAIGVLDPRASRMSLLSAGHGPNLFYEAATDVVHRWDGDAPPLGVVGGLQMNMPEPREIEFRSGDVLVLTTDGFFEWMNAAHEQYGTERLVAFVHEHHHLEPEEIIAELYESVLAFAAGTEQADDLTALVLKKT